MSTNVTDSQPKFKRSLQDTHAYAIVPVSSIISIHGSLDKAMEACLMDTSQVGLAVVRITATSHIELIPAELDIEPIEGVDL